MSAEVSNRGSPFQRRDRPTSSRLPSRVVLSDVDLAGVSKTRKLLLWYELLDIKLEREAYLKAGSSVIY